MLLAPAINASPPFCCLSHLESTSYDNDSNSNMEEVPLVKSLCQNCPICPSGESSEVRETHSTLYATVLHYRTNEASSEGDTSEYEEDGAETTIENTHIKAEDLGEDCSSSAAVELSQTLASEAKAEPERDTDTQGRTSPRDKSHTVDAKLSSTLPLPSVLKKKTRRIKGVSRRRVRGLWGSHEEDPFAQLHDDILQQTLSFLSLADVCILSMVSQRWKYLATKPSTFQTVDATEFVDRAFANFSVNSPPGKAARETAQALSEVLKDYTPRALTIRNIGIKLCADTYLPSLKGLQHLTLHNFANLTDTHIHVWMLSSTSGQGRARDIHLRSLEIESCPKLSNAAVKTIARHCPNLQALSLAGSIRVDNVKELSSLWRVEGQNSNSLQRSSSNLAYLSASSLISLDATPLTGSNGSKASIPLQPWWKEDVSRNLESPKLGPTSPKDLLGHGGMSSLFEPAIKSKLTSVYQPPKKPVPLSLRGGSGSEDGASLFLPPPGSKEDPRTPSSVFSAPAVPPKVYYSTQGLLNPPEEQLKALKAPGTSLSGLFAAPPQAASFTPFSKDSTSTSSFRTFTQQHSKPGSLTEKSSSLSGTIQPSSKTNPPVTINRPSEDLLALNSAGERASSLLGLFASQPQRKTNQSTFAKPKTGVACSLCPSKPSVVSISPKNSPGHLSGQKEITAGLFIPPKKTPTEAPSSPTLRTTAITGGLFTPPTNPKPSPERVGDSRLFKAPSELNSLFAPSLNPKAKASSNAAEMNKSGSGLFVPPANADLNPPQSPSRNPASGLESLFHPPGNSPGVSPQAAHRPTVHRRNSSQNVPTVGRLDRIDLSGTSVSPQALLKSLQQASGRVYLTSLKCTGVRRQWNEEEVRELTDVVSFTKLRVLDLEYEGPVVAEFVSHISSTSLQGGD